MYILHLKETVRVLHDLTGVTTLELQECRVLDDISAASAVVVACTGLQHLQVFFVSGQWGKPVFEQLPFPQPTSLRLHLPLG